MGNNVSRPQVNDSIHSPRHRRSERERPLIPVQLDYGTVFICTHSPIHSMSAMSQGRSRRSGHSKARYFAQSCAGSLSAAISLMF